MTQLKREGIKYIRDFIKKDYKARDACFICASRDKLELHHLYCLSDLFAEWCKKNSISTVTTETEILALREQFASDCSEELDNSNLYTLCNKHHRQLHTIYGKSYPIFKVPKVLNWLSIQREKHGN